MKLGARLADMPDVLSVEETAEILRISRGTAYEAVRQGQIPSLQVGRRRLIPKEALLRMLSPVPTDD